MAVSAATAPSFAQTARTTVIVRPDLHTGKLIRSVIAASVSPDTASVPPTNLGPNLTALIDQIATANDVEPPLVHSVIRAESNYNPSAVSNKGALGMMQLIPSTARRFGVRDVFDPKQNIEGGVRYLRFLLDYYKGDYSRAIAAYNAGEGAVDRYHGIPPYNETRNYVSQVSKNLKAARQAAESKNKLASNAFAPALPPAAATGPAETYNRVQAVMSEDGKVTYRTQ